MSWWGLGKYEAKRIACLVSWRGLGKGEVKRGEGKERVGKKLIEGRLREVEVAKYKER